MPMRVCEATCPLCKVKLPLFNKKGQHNLCPHIVNGQGMNICMKCKMREINRLWRNQQWIAFIPVN